MNKINIKKRIVVVSGPSGVGKTTVCDCILSKESRLKPCITATTRQPRLGEKNGRDYFFLTKREFIKGIKSGKFVEYTRLFGNYYGTPKYSLELLFKRGKYPLLRVDVKGAKNLKRQDYKGAYIFILPPDIGTLKERLIKRNTEVSKSKMGLRLKRAKYEMKYSRDYDFVVINDKIARVVREIRAILNKYLYK